MDKEPQPMTAEEIAICLNKALEENGYPFRVVDDEVTRLFNEADKYYNIYGFRTTKDDWNAQRLAGIFPPHKSGMVLVVSLNVAYKSGPCDFVPQDVPSLYWALDFDEGELLSEYEAFDKYRPKKPGTLPQA